MIDVTWCPFCSAQLLRVWSNSDWIDCDNCGRDFDVRTLDWQQVERDSVQVQLRAAGYLV